MTQTEARIQHALKELVTNQSVEAANFLGDLAREEEFRTQIESFDAITQIVPIFLATKNEALLIKLARLLCNLAYENATHASKIAGDDDQVAKRVISLVQNNKNLDLQKTSTAMLTNLVHEDGIWVLNIFVTFFPDKVRLLFSKSGAISTLCATLKLLANPEDDPVSLTFHVTRALENLIKNGNSRNLKIMHIWCRGGEQIVCSM